MNASTNHLVCVPIIIVLCVPIDDMDFSSTKKPEGAQRISLGKLQLLKSGKVRMRTADGKTFEVSSGLAASFQQCLSSISIPPPEPVASSSSSSSNNNNIPLPPGRLCMLGNITKKLVVTPSMEDYMHTLASRTTASTNSNSNSKIAQRDGEIVGEVGDEEMMVDAGFHDDL
jgi:hypothetical protein